MATYIIFELLLALLVAFPIAAAHWAGTHQSRWSSVVVWVYTLFAYNFIIAYAWFLLPKGGS
ncbi:MAG: hypothetical protein V3S69_04835 [Dehalococcoidales bacterium]